MQDIQSKKELKALVDNSRQNKLGVNTFIKDHLSRLIDQPIKV